MKVNSRVLCLFRLCGLNFGTSFLSIVDMQAWMGGDFERERERFRDEEILGFDVMPVFFPLFWFLCRQVVRRDLHNGVNKECFSFYRGHFGRDLCGAELQRA